MEHLGKIRKARFRFIASYVFALVLIFVVVSSFWEKKEQSNQIAADPIKVVSPESPEVENLKRQVAEKDQKIADYEKIIQQGAVTNSQPAQNDTKVSASLNEKDQTIASLQNQLKEKDAALQKASQQNTSKPAVTNTANDGEWKQKFASLKSEFDKISANEKTLKNAYKTVTDDNKRLLTQLQSIRKE